MKKLWLVLCLVLIIPMISKAESWMYEGKDEVGVRVYLDLDSIYKVVPDSDVVSFKIKADLPNTLVSAYVLGSVDFNCKTREARTTNMVLVEDGKSINKNEDVNPAWVKIPQDDVIWNRIILLICAEHQTK